MPLLAAMCLACSGSSLALFGPTPGCFSFARPRPAEGIILLDLSHPRWCMVYANDAFRAAASMPQLLCKSSGSAAPAGCAAGCPPGTVDFWSVFEQVESGSQDSYNVSGWKGC